VITARFLAAYMLLPSTLFITAFTTYLGFAAFHWSEQAADNFFKNNQRTKTTSFHLYQPKPTS
jgi:hypothetical protein